MLNGAKEDVYLFAIPGYELHEKLYEGSHSLIFRALRISDNKPVIIKVLKEEFASLDGISKFRREYQINQLAESLGNPKVFDFQKMGKTYALILEDIGGRSLNEILSSRKLSLRESLNIALKISILLARLHDKPIIHKDINPSNIVLNEKTNQVELIDFGISSVLSSEKQTTTNVRPTEGTLLYSSPEQTGRMNRGVDRRSDFYSLGVTLYEMLTGVLPFKSDDPMELIHMHMAKPPKSPSEIDPHIPEVVSQMILKLMAKTAEERYQDARGLEYDLAKCIDLLQKNGNIDPFPLGTHDLSDRFEISEKIYGRNQELTQLLEKFDLCAKGQIGLFLVSGPSGIGKTSLILEVQKPIVQKKGILISGKFDQFKQSQPYKAIIQALEDWTKQILMEGESAIHTWKQILLTAVGTSGGVITELVPSLEQILGPQSKPLKLGLAEAQEMFDLVFVKFFQALARPDRPLVIFLDNMQWTDANTLRIIKELLLHRDSKYIFIIGSYRNHEISTESIFSRFIKELEKRGFHPTILNLLPPSFVDLRQMLADTLQILPDRIDALADLCYKRSGGNPFFFIELLRYLHQNKIIHLDLKHEHWEWDLERIQKEGITENIADLLSYKIQKLGSESQRALQFASCIDFHFDLQTLSNIYQKSTVATLQDLWRALEEELIIPEDESYKYIQQESDSNQNAHFRFVHDRVQQAAYSLLSDEKKEELHYQIGKYFLKITPPGALEKNIFQIVNHLNLGERFVVSKDEKDLLIRLNYLAGKHAKNSIAFKIAADYLKNAKKWLGEDLWQKDYELTLNISKTLAECLYNSDQFEEAEKLIQDAVKNAKTNLEKAEFYLIQGTQLTSLSLFEQANSASIKGLKLLKIKIKEFPSRVSILKEFIFARWNLGKRSIPSLINEPQITAPQIHLQVRLLNSIRAPAYFMGNFNLVAFCNVKATNLSLRYGNIEESAVVYASFGGLIHAFFYDTEHGCEFIKLAKALNEKFDDPKNLPVISYLYALIVVGFSKHWKMCRQAFDQLIEASLKVGDTVNLTQGCAQALIWDPSMPRDDLLEESKRYEKYIDPKQFPFNWNFFKLTQQYIANLAGKTIDRFSMSTRTFDEYRCLQLLKQTKNKTGITIYYLRKAIVCFYYGNYTEALEKIKESSNAILGVFGAPTYTEFCFYSFLIYVANFPKLHWSEKIKSYGILWSNLRKIKKWAAYFPDNFLHKQYLMEAEWARIEGKTKKAIKFYQKAIACAKQYEFLNIEALATELAAKFYLGQNEQAVANTLMHEAYYLYYLYGASSKLKFLAETYPEIFSSTSKRNVFPVVSTIKTTETVVSPTTTVISKELDIGTAIKASQAISREIELEKLIKTMMHIIIENAGAERGWLIIQKDGYWKSVAEATLNEIILETRSIDTLPQSLINAVIFSKTPLVISNPAWLGQFAADEYLQRVHPKSVLCIPFLNHGELSGILYLENNLTAEAFTVDRLEILNLLGSQIAISIDNARLYSDLMESNKSLKILNESLARFIPRELLAILGKKSVAEVGIGDFTQKEMTILFVDIRGFTSRSEKMTPQENFKFINDFLRVMAPVIRGHEGFIDKYLGDGFMAIFPTDADKALQAATMMLKTLNHYNSKHYANETEMIRMGIGLNSGMVMLGTVGEEQRMEETVISDVVNTSSRLQEMTKIYGASLLISNETYERLKSPENYDVRKIDTVALRGKIKPITIYEVFETDLPEVVLLKRETRAQFEEAVTLFHEKKYVEAKKLFEAIIERNPRDIPAAKLLAKVIESIKT